MSRFGTALLTVSLLAVWGSSRGWDGMMAMGAKPSGNSCQTRGRTIESNSRVRLYSLNTGDIEIYACQISPRTRRPPFLVGFYDQRFGLSGLRLEGRFVGARARGAGCASRGCEGNSVTLTNTRTRHTRRIAGDVFVLRSDGVAATLGTEDGVSVVRFSGRGGGELYRGPAVDPGSLAISETSVFWSIGGEAFRAPAPGPYRE